MKMNLFVLIKYLVISLIISFSNYALAQKLEDSLFASIDKTDSDNSFDLESKLISVDSIIEIALKNSPFLKADSMAILNESYDIKLARRRWHNNISGFGNLSAGNQGFVIFGATHDQPNNLFSNGYRYGLNVSIPLSDFTNRKFLVKKSQAEMQAAIYRRDQTEVGIRKLVIEEYNKLIAAQRLLKIKASAKESADLIYQMAEKQFREGSVSLDQYANISDMSVRADVDFELAKSSFRSIYLQFEDLVGVELTSLMKKK